MCKGGPRHLSNILIPAGTIIGILVLWQIAHMAGWLPRYMLPAPTDVAVAFVKDFPLLMKHAGTTLYEAFLGLGIAVVLALILSALMERFSFLYKALNPILVLTQTIPTVAIAPLLVLWMGYETAPKITLVVITGFFPLAVNLLNGYRSVDPDAVRLLRAMGATPRQIFIHVKLPGSMSHFFSGLYIATSYAIVGAVIAEWLGGFSGLGVYMTRVKKSFAYDKMFAVILLISIISLLLLKIIDIIRKKTSVHETNTA
ncbi:MAG: ABC transporter permease [Eubacterium sp.]|nr:ABC transporter permease [Eubacterium sp.]